MDVLKRIKYFMDLKQWSEYKLAMECKVPQSTINSMFKKNNNPSIYTLQCICDGLQITMSDFFNTNSDDEAIPIEYRDIIDKWRKLDPKQKKAFLMLIDTIID